MTLAFYRSESSPSLQVGLKYVNNKPEPATVPAKPQLCFEPLFVPIVNEKAIEEDDAPLPPCKCEFYCVKYLLPMMRTMLYITVVT